MAGIVTDVWHDEASRDPAGEAERVMNLLGVKPALAVADIGAGSDYYTVRLARRLGRTGHVFVVGYLQTRFHDLQAGTHLVVFAPPSPGSDPALPAAIWPCVPPP